MRSIGRAETVDDQHFVERFRQGDANHFACDH